MKIPPRFLLWLLDRLCPTSRPDLKGDFLEVYHDRVEELGRMKANMKFLMDVLSVLPFKFMIKETHLLNPASMLSTYLKMARRNLAKSKLHTVINLTGLSVSLTACLLITLFVRDEISFDKHFPEGDKIYRIAGNYQSGGQDKTGSAATSYMLLPLIEQTVSGIDYSARLEFRWETIRINDQQYLEPEVIFADSTFFRIFPMPFVSGNPATVLNDPNSVVVDESIAQKYFGSENAIGKFIELKEKQFIISAVMKEMPSNSHFRGRIIFPMSGVSHWFQDWVKTNMSGRNMYTYIKVQPGFDIRQGEASLKKIITEHWPSDNEPDLFLQPITSIHLQSNLEGEISDNGSQMNIYIFSVTALVILALACINYINLTLAAALERSKEVGIKKILGSTARMQFAQFQMEAFIVVIFSALLALVLARWFMPLFNQLSGKSLEINLLADPLIAVELLAVIVVVGLFAGGFPVMVLLRMGTMSMLSGKIEFRQSTFSFRSTLIVFQFAITITLMASTALVMNQIRYMRNKSIGVDPEQLVMIPLPSASVSSRYEVLKTEMLRHPDILRVAASGNKVTHAISGWRPYVTDWFKEDVNVPSIVVSYDFFETMKATMVEGRTFSREHQTDLKESFIINEAAAKFLKLKKPVDSNLFGFTFNGSKWFEKNARIIGVVNDFHFASLHSKVEPVIFSLASETTEPLSWMEVRISTKNIPQTIASLEDVWTSYVPEVPFQFEFMEEAIQQHYQAENRFAQIFRIFSILSILLGGLGLFGLAAFMTKRRIKEIGIRKIMGASMQTLISILTIDLLKLVLISNLIGWPVAYYFIHHWLQGFAYQTPISIWIFLYTGFAAMLIAFLAIVYHSLKASRVNPVILLKND